VTTSSGSNGATPPPAETSISIFDDLDALRIADPANLAGDIEHLTYIAVRKPKRDEYFRTSPDPALSLPAMQAAAKEAGRLRHRPQPALKREIRLRPRQVDAPPDQTARRLWDRLHRLE
jgi:hypothetical protein